jgi:hypothetical protein
LGVGATFVGTFDNKTFDLRFIGGISKEFFVDVVFVYFTLKRAKGAKICLILDSQSLAFEREEMVDIIVIIEKVVA